MIVVQPEAQSSGRAQDGTLPIPGSAGLGAGQAGLDRPFLLTVGGVAKGLPGQQRALEAGRPDL